jgi:DNA-binding MarR family transcriptional regulator
MEATVKRRGGSGTDRELALQLGSVMLFCFGGSGGEVLKVIDESGLSFVQMKAVVALESADQPEAITVTAVADSLGISPASASRAVEGLVKKRLATRVEDPEDRRVRRLTLTAKGQELADRIISARLAGLEEFTASLDGNERSRLAVALDTLMERDEIAQLYRRNATRAGASR